MTDAPPPDAARSVTPLDLEAAKAAHIAEMHHNDVMEGVFYEFILEIERLRALLASSVVSPPNPTGKVTRLEVIDESGRRFTRWHCGIELSYQDRGRTLKIFVGPQVPDTLSLLSPEDPKEPDVVSLDDPTVPDSLVPIPQREHQKPT